MVNENNTNPELERDFEKIQELYHQQKMDNPSESAINAIRAKAQKTIKPKHGIYWFLSWERSIGFAVVFLIVAGMGILFKQSQLDQKESLTVTEVSTIPEARDDFRAPAPRFQPSVPSMKKAVPAEFGISSRRTIAPSFTSTGVGGRNSVSEVAPPPAPSGGIIADYDEGRTRGIEAEKAKAEKKDKKVAAKHTAVEPAGYTSALTAAPPGSKLDQTYLYALQLETKGKYLLATQAFSSIWKANPYFHQREDLLFHWADCLSKLGRKKVALNKLALLEQINPNYPGLKEAKKSINK